MKKNLIVALAVCMVFSIPTYAYHDSPNPLIEESFKNHFPGGSEPVWKKTIENENVYHVRFKNDDYLMDAFFSTEGTLVGYGRPVELKLLPFNIQKIFNEDYGHYRVMNIWEVFRDNQIGYLFELRSEKKYILIEIKQDGNITRHKKKLLTR